METGNALGARLRALRLERELSQRQLTRLIGLSAHSNLADYEAGRRVPPVDIVAACERALGVADGELVALRQEVLVDRRSDRLTPDDDVAPAQRPRRPVTPYRVGLACLGVAVLAVGVWIALSWHHSAAPAATTVGLSACDNDAYVLNTATLAAAGPITAAGQTLPPASRLGTISLRFSPSCTLAWARFLPTAATTRDAVWLQLEVHRVQDGATTVLRLPRAVAAESDPLLTVAGCVYARAVIGFAGGQTVAGQTGCFQRG